MWNRCNVFDQADIDAGGLESPQRRFSARAGTTNKDLHAAQTVVHGFLAALSAACWAANGVPLREPLKPIAPALDQEITLP